MSTKTGRRPRVLFFGMQSDFSTPSLQALLANDIDVCAVVMPGAAIPGLHQPALQRREPLRGRRAALPLHSHNVSILEIAWEQQLPVWEVRGLSDATTHSTLAAYEADIVCVACFSQRIPRATLALPRLGCLNVHPSLLPANRGPVPLFWTFRNGERVTGVTIHFLQAAMDTGDIVAQETIPVSDGVSYARLEMHCAAQGGVLLANAVHTLHAGDIVRTPQDEANSSTYSFPTGKDFVVQAEAWDARHVYNFINGVGDWGEPIAIQAGAEILFTRACASYSLLDGDEPQEKGDTNDSGWKSVCCRDGWVRVKTLDTRQR